MNIKLAPVSFGETLNGLWRISQTMPQGLKSGVFQGVFGPIEVVPCYKAQCVDLFIIRLSKIEIHQTKMP
jgi:hypothetical protein